ncbi:MAG: arylamine N-acetyltransferase [Spirochaetales bacterium]|nr:arylamine N-acetyltransferase [Spirochaetales bacterium]
MPFENFDVTFQREIELDAKRIFQKVVHHRRGGFCYELNYNFYRLLKSLNYSVQLISAQVLHGKTFGAEFDHLALLVDLEDVLYLVDVGFGNFSSNPINLSRLKVSENIAFKVDFDGEFYTLFELNEKHQWQAQYQFTLQPRCLKQFSKMCVHHQTSTQSPFTKKSLCTITTEKGYTYLSNNQLVRVEYGQKISQTIDDEFQLEFILQETFGVSLPKEYDRKILLRN